jgi:serine/threonine protein phosphatase PrpC
MGNLLGAPVTEKETHEGSSPDAAVDFAVSTMQGWRVHMEDAHILEPRMYALEVNSNATTRRKIELPGHALFAVFDGHGGTFAAAYAGRNLCRVLSRQPKFVAYAEFEQTRAEKEKLLGTSSERANLARTGLELLEAALCDAFVDLDREIAQALKGVKVAEADQPYHNRSASNSTTNHHKRNSSSSHSSKHNSQHKRSMSSSDGPSSSSSSSSSTTTTVTTTTTATTTTMMQGVVVEEGFVSATATVSSVRPLENGGAPEDEEDDDGDDDDEVKEQDPEDDDDDPDDDDDDDDALGSPSDSALQLLEEEGDSGTTACVVLLTPTHVLCANAGDSRAVISRLGHRAVPLSYDHKPDDEGEERRIRAAGGYVAAGRVEGDLAVSRGLGDFRFKNMNTVMAATSVFRYGEPANHGSDPNNNKNAGASGSSWASSIGSLRLPHGLGGGGATAQEPAPLMKPGDQKVSPIPDVVIQGRNPLQDEFILVACDGIWDVLTNYEAVQTVAELFKEGESSLGLICEEVRASSWRRPSPTLDESNWVSRSAVPSLLYAARRSATCASAWGARTT